MPQRTRRATEPSVIGLKVMAGLPTENGLAPIAPTLEPMGSVLVVARLVVGRGAQNYRKDSGQRILEIEEIEGALTEEETAIVQGILDAARERRTGEQTMPLDGMPEPPGAEPEDWAEGRAPSGTPKDRADAAKPPAEEKKAAKVTDLPSRSRRRR